MLHASTRQPLEIHEFTIEPFEIELSRETAGWAFQELDLKTFLVETMDKLARLPALPPETTFCLFGLMRV